ncbi:hypothetical protein EYB45_00780 [Erythrobacteraceae bacterium CFH 75059]|uniref:hypothetical protein n=1 Tax=Qipengyuania thermophila TaxID=2509361 RepID=UPI00102170BB|nr:hypothetical protein [Qipengyuania thermophila]TCD06305.1 hypothetical protein EYB45_00780 [Erythrobacteraceae bacterium CFH 75059]
MAADDEDVSADGGPPDPADGAPGAEQRAAPPSHASEPQVRGAPDAPRRDAAALLPHRPQQESAHDAAAQVVQPSDHILHVPAPMPGSKDAALPSTDDPALLFQQPDPEPDPRTVGQTIAVPVEPASLRADQAASPVGLNTAVPLPGAANAIITDGNVPQAPSATPAPAIASGEGAATARQDGTEPPLQGPADGGARGVMPGVDEGRVRLSVTHREFGPVRIDIAARREGGADVALVSGDSRFGPAVLLALGATGLAERLVGSSAPLRDDPGGGGQMPHENGSNSGERETPDQRRGSRSAVLPAYPEWRHSAAREHEVRLRTAGTRDGVYV